MFNQAIEKTALSLVEQLALIVEKAASSKFAIVVFALLTICLFTRLFSGRSPKTVEGGLRVPGLLPYWIPYVGHASWLTISPEKMGEALLSTQEGIFGLTVGGRIFNIVVKPSLVKAVFGLKRNLADNHDMIFYVAENFIGSSKEMGKTDPTVLWGDIHHAVNIFLKPSYVDRTISVLVKSIEAQVPNLVSIDKDIVEQSEWIGLANVVAVPGDKPSFEVDFFHLLRTAIASIVSPAILGTAFMRNNPGIIQDLWNFDSGMAFFMIKTPRWIPISTNRKAHVSRDRLRAASFEFMNALSLSLDGKDPGPRWKDLSDVSEVIWERCKAWRRSGQGMEVWAGGEMIFFWVMNVNANPLIFWFLLRIYSSPTYLAQIRAEIAPYITSSASQPLSLNIPGILKSCNLLKAAYYECLRMDVSSVSNKVAHSDFYVTESPEDAFGGPPQSYLIRKGEYVQIYHNMHQNDPRYFPDPDVFRPERFLVEDVEENGSIEKQDVKEVNGKEVKGKLVATQGTIRPFGGGVTFCKGSKIAEREILLYVASVVTIWDAEPVGGEWKIPEHQRSSGSFLPKAEIRVRLTRRI